MLGGLQHKTVHGTALQLHQPPKFLLLCRLASSKEWSIPPKGEGQQALSSMQALKGDEMPSQAVGVWPAQLPRSLLQARPEPDPITDFPLFLPRWRTDQPHKGLFLKFQIRKPGKQKERHIPKSIVGQIPVFLCHLSFKSGFFQASANPDKLK